MTGVVGLGQRAMAGQRGPGAAAKAAAFDQLGMQVTPANVLGVYGVIMEEMTRLQSSAQMFKLDHGEGMPLLGGDLVSPPAARGFTEATSQLLIKCQADIDDLKRVGYGLAEAARLYGKTEEEVKAAFDPSAFQYQPSPPPPSTGDVPSSLRPMFDSGQDSPLPAASLEGLMRGGAR
jgi:hypothetical protein